MQEVKYDDFRYIKPMYKFAMALGIAPPLDFENSRIHSVSGYKYYGTFIGLLYTFGSVLSLAGRMLYAYPLMVPTVTFIDSICAISMTVFNVFSIISMSFIYVNDVTQLFQYFARVDIKLQRSKVFHRKKLIASIVAYHFIIILFSIFDAYVWMKSVTFKILRYYIFRYFQYYHSFTFVMLMTHIILMIKDRLQQLNDLLKHSLESTKTPPGLISVYNIKTNISTYNTNVKKIKNIARTLTILTDIIDMFNKIFGWHILLLNLNILAGLLSPISLAIVYTSPQEDIDGATFGVDLICLCMVWGGMILLLGVIVAASCDMAVKEASDLGTITFKILQELPEAKVALCDDLLREELLILGQQASLKCPTFSAAGFFNVDFTMLYNVLGSVTSYVVVIVQFK